MGFHRRPDDFLRVGHVAQHHYGQLTRPVVHLQLHHRVQIRGRLDLRRVQPHELGHIQRVGVDAADHGLDGALGLLGIPAHGAVILLVHEGVRVCHLVHGQLIRGQHAKVVGSLRLVPPVGSQGCDHVLGGRAGHVGEFHGQRAAGEQQRQRQGNAENAFHVGVSFQIGSLFKETRCQQIVQRVCICTEFGKSVRAERVSSG